MCRTSPGSGIAICALLGPGGSLAWRFCGESLQDWRRRRAGDPGKVGIGACQRNAKRLAIVVQAQADFAEIGMLNRKGDRLRLNGIARSNQP
ncbi:MAG TPA: hypothetical protein VFV30_02315, partial [Novosphingobium sp.]|nr:hypothetical protein [Novosphingobium sp.]